MSPYFLIVLVPLTLIVGLLVAVYRRRYNRPTEDYFKSFLRQTRGQDLVEYSLLMAFVAAASAALYLGAGGTTSWEFLRQVMNSTWAQIGLWLLAGIFLVFLLGRRRQKRLR